MMFVRLTFVAVVCCAAGAAQAQVIPAGQFIGDLSDPFDFINPGTAHLTFDIFGGVVQLRAPVETAEYNRGAIKVELFSSLDGVAVSPHSGNYMISFLFDDGDPRPGVFYFNDDNVHRFGGFFANNSPTNNGLVEMFDAAGAKLGSFILNAPSGGNQWVWNGWSSSIPIKWITIKGFSPDPFSGGFIWFDDLELDNAVPPVTGVCCQGSRNCWIMTEADCADVFGSTFLVGMTSCADGNGSGSPDVCEAPVEVCYADCATASSDNEVNVEDLIDMLSHWGAGSVCDIAPAPNGDGMIDVLDLVDLLAAWGTCP